MSIVVICHTECRCARAPMRRIRRRSGSLWRRRERLCQTRLPVLHRCTLAVRDSDAPPGSARVTLGVLRVRSSPVSHLLRCPRSTQVTDLELASLSGLVGAARRGARVFGLLAASTH